MKNDALFLCLKITTIISLVHVPPVITYNVDHAVYVGFQSLILPNIMHILFLINLTK